MIGSRNVGKTVGKTILCSAHVRVLYVHTSIPTCLAAMFHLILTCYLLLHSACQSELLGRFPPPPIPPSLMSVVSSSFPIFGVYTISIHTSIYPPSGLWSLYLPHCSNEKKEKRRNTSVNENTIQEPFTAINSKPNHIVSNNIHLLRKLRTWFPEHVFHYTPSASYQGQLVQYQEKRPLMLALLFSFITVVHATWLPFQHNLIWSMPPWINGLLPQIKNNESTVTLTLCVLRETHGYIIFSSPSSKQSDAVQWWSSCYARSRTTQSSPHPWEMSVEP